MQDKRVLVTAAGQGIGRAVAELFAAHGAKVVATDLDAGLLKDFPGESHPLDVRDPEAITRLIETLGPIDVLVNCAGVVHGGTVLTMREADLDLALDLNLKGMVRMIRAVLPGMLAQGGGAIINMASVVSSLKGAPDRCAYGISKAAVIGLTKSIAADYVTQGIRCNAICPGTVDSPSLRQRLIATGDEAQARKAFLARQPMGRFGTPEEIAELALHLARSGYTTGQALAIDGGWTT